MYGALFLSHDNLQLGVRREALLACLRCRNMQQERLAMLFVVLTCFTGDVPKAGSGGAQLGGVVSAPVGSICAAAVVRWGNRQRGTVIWPNS